MRGAGLSPRVRGNHVEHHLAGRGVGSIPACAGEPSRWRRATSQVRVYPRVCGGTEVRGVSLSLPAGLSPRVRGNRRAGAARRPRSGSIPACAGEPHTRWHLSKHPRVYPRVCGGTQKSVDHGILPKGLSPRVRGNRHPPQAQEGLGGSIPACAGEPRGGRGGATHTRVYPRVCGGTRCTVQQLADGDGLSPRVRGNPGDGAARVHIDGSIPACAGEPSPICGCGRRTGVYPRVCGGTAQRWRIPSSTWGLSPRVRGEPHYGNTTRDTAGVYPRVCGGTLVAAAPDDQGAGLSPRVRGNLRAYSCPCLKRGSIPACAGEPARICPR